MRIGSWGRARPAARDPGTRAEKAVPTASICRLVNEAGQLIAAMYNKTKVKMDAANIRSHHFECRNAATPVSKTPDVMRLMKM